MYAHQEYVDDNGAEEEEKEEEEEEGEEEGEEEEEGDDDGDDGDDGDDDNEGGGVAAEVVVPFSQCRRPKSPSTAVINHWRWSAVSLARTRNARGRMMRARCMPIPLAVGTHLDG